MNKLYEKRDIRQEKKPSYHTAYEHYLNAILAYSHIHSLIANSSFHYEYIEYSFIY
jgi:hypothetical protein